MKHYQLSFQDLPELLDWLSSQIPDDDEGPAEPQMDTETPTDCTFIETKMTPIEQLIHNRIQKHIADGTFPSESETAAIYTLDQINRSYACN